MQGWTATTRHILDDYLVLITDEVRKALLAKGYILMVIGGGITDDVQCNVTHVHYFLKQKYGMLQAELTIEILRKDPDTIPPPSLDEIMKLKSKNSKSLRIDQSFPFDACDRKCTRQHT